MHWLPEFQSEAQRTVKTQQLSEWVQGFFILYCFFCFFCFCRPAISPYGSGGFSSKVSWCDGGWELLISCSWQGLTRGATEFKGAFMAIFNFGRLLPQINKVCLAQKRLAGAVQASQRMLLSWLSRPPSPPGWQLSASATLAAAPFSRSRA